jgi:hypothetical protein
LFIFDVTRRAIVLVAGDKAGQWDQWYRKMVPLAEETYESYVRGEEI